MALADAAMYVVILGEIGRVEMAVTSNFSINFLQRPKPQDLLAEALLLKLGSWLAYSEVRLTSAGESDLVAHATGTYAVPSM